MNHNYIPSKFYKSDSGHSLASLNGLHSELKTWFRKFKGISTKHSQGYLDLFRYLKHLKYKTEYDKRINETYCFAIPPYTTVLIDNIYNEPMPIKLQDAYKEYTYSIFSQDHQSLS